jgi:hypothetical protein
VLLRSMGPVASVAGGAQSDDALGVRITPEAGADTLVISLAG